MSEEKTIETDDRCQFWIRRKQRRCILRVADSDKNIFCSEHSPEALELSRKIAEDAKVFHECWLTINTIISDICSLEGKSEDIPSDGRGRKRRQAHSRVSAPKRMANPFSTDLTPSVDHVSMKSMFKDINLPVHIDIGCARGKCIELLSTRPERYCWNHLGLEIRPKIVNSSLENLFRSDKSLRNIYFVACNFAFSAEQLFRHIPTELIRLITIQFPDPWRRNKHMKRMLIQPQLVDFFSKSLKKGALIYISTDSLKSMKWMLKCFDCSSFRALSESDVIARGTFRGSFVNKDTDRLDGNVNGTDLLHKDNAIEGTVAVERFAEEENCDSDIESAGHEDDNEDDGDDIMLRYQTCLLSYNPLAVPSEREKVCEFKWRSVYRIIFELQNEN